LEEVVTALQTELALAKQRNLELEEQLTAASMQQHTLELEGRQSRQNTAGLPTEPRLDELQGRHDELQDRYDKLKSEHQELKENIAQKASTQSEDHGYFEKQLLQLKKHDLSQIKNVIQRLNREKGTSFSSDEDRMSSARKAAQEGSCGHFFHALSHPVSVVSVDAAFEAIKKALAQKFPETTEEKSRTVKKDDPNKGTLVMTHTGGKLSGAQVRAVGPKSRSAAPHNPTTAMLRLCIPLHNTLRPLTVSARRAECSRRH
jgi:hypothetical protein